jgi:hypothetical protein
MTTRIRTIALLMLLAGLSLGIFAVRAVRAIAPGDVERPAPQGDAHVEQLLEYYRRQYDLDPVRTDRVRKALKAYQSGVSDLLWKLRKEHQGEFDVIYEDANQTIQAILAEGK